MPAKISVAPHDLYISGRQFFGPDISFVRRERFASERIECEDDACLVTPPDLIVVIVSPSAARRDRVDKLNAYAEFSVTHYWMRGPRREDRVRLRFARSPLRGEAALCAEAITDEQTGEVTPPAEPFAPSLFNGLLVPLKSPVEH